MTCAAVTRPIEESPASTPPIVYDSLAMSVCGGSSTCCRVSRGVVIVARNCCMRSGRHLANAPPPPGPMKTPRRAVRDRLAPRPPPDRSARGAAVLLDAGLDLLQLRLGGRLDPARDVDPVAAGLDLRHDLRHLALLVHGLEQQARRDGADLVERGDLLSLALGERELRAGEEEVVDEALAGLAELGEVGHTERFASTRSRPAPGKPPPARQLARHGQVGADPGEWVERRLLRAFEPVREAGDRDHEAHAEREPEA